MRIGLHVLALSLALGSAAGAAAQEDPTPAKEAPANPAAETPAPEAQAEPAKEAEPADAPEPVKEAEPVKAVAPAPAAPAAPAAPKELSACAGALVPVADSYKKAYEAMQAWIADIDSKTAADNQKVEDLKKKIQDNDAAISKAKLDGDSAKSKELTKSNKALMTEFEAAKKSQAASCGGFEKEAPTRVKQYSAETNAKLDEYKSKNK